LLKRLLKEPLLHFLLLALVIFAAHGVLGPSGAGKSESIIVTSARIEQIGAIFAKTWQRPPTADELKSLIDDYVKEEIYYREAKLLGLDTDDTIIRRRLRQKMEFLSDAAAELLTPTDVELDAYLKAHPAQFEIEPMLAFQQVFLNPERHGDKIDQDAAAILEVLLTNVVADPATLGDPTLLPFGLPLTRNCSIAQTFGPEFVEALGDVALGQWAGPITSGFGRHIVRVLERKAGRVPALGEVRDAVAREWNNAKRRELEDRRFDELLKRYEVTIESPSEAAP
jgi:hypothetical protein